MSESIKHKKVTISVSTGHQGSEVQEIIDVPADIKDEELEKTCKEVMFGMIEWGYWDTEEEEEEE